jgi:lipid A 4'-phosphatase
MTRSIVSDIHKHPGRWALAVLGLLLLIVAIFPALDFSTSAPFYIPGTGFTWDRDGLLEFVRDALPNIIIGSFLVCIGLWLAGLVRPLPWSLSGARIVFLLLTLLIGPGLIVEALLKTTWGRARPKDIGEFGGAATYTPFWQATDQCISNCSFVSGHAAVAFWVTAYAFLLPPKWRAAGLFAGLAFGTAVGWVRIMQGGHFLSDVIGAGFVVLAVNVVLARAILKQPA